MSLMPPAHFKNKFIGLAALALLLAFTALIPSPAQCAEKKIAVLPWNVRSAPGMEFLKDALNDMLTSRLGAAGEDVGDISIVRADRIKTALSITQDKDITLEKAKSIGKKLDTNYILFGSITVIGKAVSLDASLLDVSGNKVTAFSSTGPSHDSIVGLVDGLSKKIIHHFHPERALPVEQTAMAPALPLASVPTPSPREAMITRPQKKTTREDKKPSFWKSDLIKGEFVSMASGDLDGNGVKELFLLEKTSVRIVEVVDNNLRIIDKIKASSGVEFVSVSVVDSDNDGKVEVYVSALNHLTASSLVIEYVNGSYEIGRRNIAWLLRAGRSPEGKPLLFGQRFRGSDGFYGGIDIITKNGLQSFTSEPYIKRLPRKVNLYNFTYMRFNSQNPSEKHLLAFDKEGRVIVFKRKKKGWKAQWKSKEYYGGTMHRIEFNKDTSGSDTYRYVDVERPLIHMDTDGDGQDELIVRQSRAEGVFKRFARVFKSYSGGSVLSLTWDGEFLTEGWRTREINGYIADFFVDDLKGSGDQKLIMLVRHDSSIISSTPKSYLLIYDINP